MSSAGYLRMVDEGNLSVQLLPVGPVHDHPKSECRTAACFSDVVVRKEKAYVKHGVRQLCCDICSFVLRCKFSNFSLFK